MNCSSRPSTRSAAQEQEVPAFLLDVQELRPAEVCERLGLRSSALSMRVGHGLGARWPRRTSSLTCRTGWQRCLPADSSTTRPSRPRQPEPPALPAGQGPRRRLRLVSHGSGRDQQSQSGTLCAADLCDSECAARLACTTPHASRCSRRHCANRGEGGGRRGRAHCRIERSDRVGKQRPRHGEGPGADRARRSDRRITLRPDRRPGHRSFRPFRLRPPRQLNHRPRVVPR